MNLIYDRTAQDVEIARTQRGTTLTPLKGCYNITDLNRVEQAVKTLAAALTSAGYPVEVTPVMKGSSRVPEGYTEVEYIAASGTQYIDSGVAETADTAVDCKFDIDTVASDYLFGTRQNSSNLSYNGIYKNNVLEYNYNEISFTAADSIELTEEVTGSTNHITINGVSHTAATGTGTGETMLIFAIRYQTGYNDGRIRPYGGATKLRYFKIKQNGALVREFIPCKNPSGTVGLYDLVGGEFYTTPTAVALPDGYTQLEYIQSSGTQYIDTGYKPNSSTKLTATLQFVSSSSGNKFCFGARTSNSVGRFSLGYSFGSSGSWFFGYNTTVPNVTSAVSPTGKTSVIIDKNVCTVGGYSATASQSTFSCAQNLVLFADNEGGTIGQNGSIKLYDCSIYDNGVLIRNFIPARNSSGTLGLYDTVNGAFYTNAGSGTFTAGADIVGFTSGAEIGTVEDREWQEGDVLYRPQWTTYLDNVQKLRDAYYTLAETGALPAPGDKLNYTGANTIEKVLADIDLLLDGMKSIYRRAGTFTAGGNYTRQTVRCI